MDELGKQLKLYFCGACGTVSTKNHRDDACPVCHVAMNWHAIDDLGELGLFDAGRAPHTEN